MEYPGLTVENRDTSTNPRIVERIVERAMRHPLYRELVQRHPIRVVFDPSHKTSGTYRASLDLSAVGQGRQRAYIVMATGAPRYTDKTLSFLGSDPEHRRALSLMHELGHHVEARERSIQPRNSQKGHGLGAPSALHIATESWLRSAFAEHREHSPSVYGKEDHGEWFSESLLALHEFPHLVSSAVDAAVRHVVALHGLAEHLPPHHASGLHTRHDPRTGHFVAGRGQ